MTSNPPLPRTQGWGNHGFRLYPMVGQPPVSRKMRDMGTLKLALLETWANREKHKCGRPTNCPILGSGKWSRTRPNYPSCAPRGSGL